MAAKKKGRPRKPTLPVIPKKHPAPNGATWKFLTIDDWRANPTCVNFIKELHANKLYQMYLGMLHNWAITRSGMPVNDTACAIELGRIEGRHDLLKTIEQSGYPLVVANEEQKAYGYPDYDEEESIESTKII